ADGDTFAAALAFIRVDKDGEETAGFASLHRKVKVFAGLDEGAPERGFVVAGELRVENLRFCDPRQNGGDGGLVGTLPASHAGFRVESGDLRSEMAKAPVQRRGGRHQAAGGVLVGGQLRFAAMDVALDHPFTKIFRNEPTAADGRVSQQSAGAAAVMAL